MVERFGGRTTQINLSDKLNTPEPKNVISISDINIKKYVDLIIMELTSLKALLLDFEYTSCRIRLIAPHVYSERVEEIIERRTETILRWGGLADTDYSVSKLRDPGIIKPTLSENVTHGTNIHKSFANADLFRIGEVVWVFPPQFIDSLNQKGKNNSSQNSSQSTAGPQYEASQIKNMWFQRFRSHLKCFIFDDEQHFSLEEFIKNIRIIESIDLSTHKITLEDVYGNKTVEDAGTLREWNPAVPPLYSTKQR